jgi:ribonuclease BN (tRNA processing enzyme)
MPWRDAVQFAAAHDVGRLWLFHHQPGRTDEELEQIRAAAQREFAGSVLAAEGVNFEV